MRERIDNIGGRKVIVFLLSCAIAIGASFLMDDVAYYKEFLQFIIFLSGIFFGANGIEHLSSAIGKKK